MSRSDMTILNESFNIYYNDGMRALENKDYSMAYRNLMAAAETLFKLAKISPKDLSGARIKRANDLYSMAKEIKGKYNYTQKDTFMGFHCGNTASSKLTSCEMKYQMIMKM